MDPMVSGGPPPAKKGFILDTWECTTKQSRNQTILQICIDIYKPVFVWTKWQSGKRIDFGQCFLDIPCARGEQVTQGSLVHQTGWFMTLRIQFGLWTWNPNISEYKRQWSKDSNYHTLELPQKQDLPAIPGGCFLTHGGEPNSFRNHINEITSNSSSKCFFPKAPRFPGLPPFPPVRPPKGPIPRPGVHQSSQDRTLVAVPQLCRLRADRPRGRRRSSKWEREVQRTRRPLWGWKDCQCIKSTHHHTHPNIYIYMFNRANEMALSSSFLPWRASQRCAVIPKARNPNDPKIQTSKLGFGPKGEMAT